VEEAHLTVSASKRHGIFDIHSEQIMLTATQLSFFDLNQFVTMDRLTSDAVPAAIRETVEDLFTRRSGVAEGAFFDFAGSSDEDGVFALPQILGPDSAFAADHALVKPALLEVRRPGIRVTRSKTQASSVPRSASGCLSRWLIT
jgi:hypothetical protein